LKETFQKSNYCKKKKCQKISNFISISIKKEEKREKIALKNFCSAEISNITTER
jgi:hypothetical protein